MTLDEAREHVGHKVVYRAPHVRRSEAGEEGVVTSVNDHYVFVRYSSKAGSQATYPAQLTLMAPATANLPKRQTED